MTNAEKFLKDGVVAKELWKTFQVYYYENKSKESDVEKAFRNFFNEQAKPTLTEDERVILRNIKWKGYSATHIGRARENKGSFIYIRFENDIEMTYYFDNFFGHLFQFIKERRRILNRGIIRRVKMTKKRKDEIAKKIKQLEKELSGMPAGFYTGVNGKAIRI